MDEEKITKFVNLINSSLTKEERKLQIKMFIATLTEEELAELQQAAEITLSKKQKKDQN